MDHANISRFHTGNGADGAHQIHRTDLGFFAVSDLQLQNLLVQRRILLPFFSGSSSILARKAASPIGKLLYGGRLLRGIVCCSKASICFSSGCSQLSNSEMACPVSPARRCGQCDGYMFPVPAAAHN